MQDVAHLWFAHHPRPAALLLCSAFLAAITTLSTRAEWPERQPEAGVHVSTELRGLALTASPFQRETDGEPPASAAFIAAFSLADEATAELAASPLYAAEWARRGLDARQREALAPRTLLPDGSRAPWTSFTFAGSTVARNGFRQLFYLGWQPTCDANCHASSVWRVDTEPSGRVIWAEMVWLFHDGVASIVVKHADNGLLPIAWPDYVASRHPRLMLAIQSSSGSEGYYAASVDGDLDSVFFFAVGPDGEARPGAWSYGRQDPGPSAYGEKRATYRQTISTSREMPRQAYLASMR